MNFLDPGLSLTRTSCMDVEGIDITSKVLEDKGFTQKLLIIRKDWKK